MAWYEYSQNNSGGKFDYDPLRGLTCRVFIEADTSAKADERAQRIGIYFDGVDSGYDCGCCGDRWYAGADWRETSVENIPAENEPMIRDDNKPGFQPMRWLKAGQFETFVHPLQSEFYGAHGEFIHIERETTGYGLYFTETFTGDIIEVGWDGWDRTGNHQFPAPDAKQYGDGTATILDNGMRLEKLESFHGGSAGYRLWSKTRAPLEALQTYMTDFVANRALPDYDSIFTAVVTAELEKGVSDE